MTLPKLPEPDDIHGINPVKYFSLPTVRAIQEEAYRAGMAAALECTCPAKEMPFGRCAKTMLSAVKEDK